MVYSLRSAVDGVDVEQIALKFGGGGHERTASFKIHPDQKLGHVMLFVGKGESHDTATDKV